MDTKKWKAEILVPLLSTVVGGLLALLGGILATTYQSSVVREIDREKLAREKLERAYMLSLQADEWAISQLRQAVAVNIATEIESPKDTTLEVVMLIRLYSPELAEQAEALERSREIYNNKAFAYYGALTASAKREAEGKDRLSSARAGSKEFAEMGRAYENFHSEVKKTLRSLERLFRGLA